MSSEEIRSYLIVLFPPLRHVLAYVPHLYLAYLDLKLAIFGDVTIFSGNLFNSSITLIENQFPFRVVLQWSGLAIFRLWPLSPVVMREANLE